MASAHHSIANHPPDPMLRRIMAVEVNYATIANYLVR